MTVSISEGARNPAGFKVTNSGIIAFPLSGASIQQLGTLANPLAKYTDGQLQLEIRKGVGIFLIKDMQDVCLAEAGLFA